MEFLPNELLLHIFKYLDAITILKVRAVCKLWYELIVPENYPELFEEKLLGEYNVINSPEMSPFQSYRCYKLWKCLHSANIKSFCLEKLFEKPLTSMEFFSLSPEGCAIIQADDNYISFLRLNDLELNEFRLKGIYKDFIVTSNIRAALAGNNVLYLFKRNNLQTQPQSKKVIYNVTLIRYCSRTHKLYYIKNERTIWCIDEYSDDLESSEIINCEYDRIIWSEKNHTQWLNEEEWFNNTIQINDFHINEENVTLICKGCGIQFSNRSNESSLTFEFPEHLKFTTYICDQFALLTNGAGYFICIADRKIQAFQYNFRAIGMFYHAKLLFMYSSKTLRIFLLDNPNELYRFPHFEKNVLLMTVNLEGPEEITSVAVHEYPKGHKILIFTEFKLFILDIDYFDDEKKCGKCTVCDGIKYELY